MRESIIQIITAGIGTLGFSIYFRVNEKNVIASTLGGIIGWSVYLLIYHITASLFFANFVAALILCLYGETAARILKAPSNTYLIPGIIPLLPGGTLYYTMYGLVDRNKNMFIDNGTKTVVITFGIAAGIVVGTVLTHYYFKLKGKVKGKGKN